MTMEILLEPTSNKLLVVCFETFRSILTDSKVTPTKPERMTKPDSSPNFIASCFIIDSLKDGHGEQYEHVSPEVTRSQEGKRSQDDDKRVCLVDDLKEVQVHIQVKPIRTSSSLKSKITTSCSLDEVKKTSLRA
ncbi:hypothetical protein Tco_0637649 [Tanacetum coccineum]